MLFPILISAPNGSHQKKLCAWVRGSPWVIAEISSPCRLPPTWTLLFQTDPVLPATSRYSLFCHCLHLEILRQIHSLTSQTISVSACTLNNKAMGSFFQDFFFFNFTSLIPMPLGALTSERRCVRSVGHCHQFASRIIKPHPCYDTGSNILCTGLVSPCLKDSLLFTPVLSHFIPIMTGNTKVGHWGLWTICVPRSHERFPRTLSGNMSSAPRTAPYVT